MMINTSPPLFEDDEDDEDDEPAVMLPVAIADPVPALLLDTTQ
jgi:hypothetical protein